MKFAAVAVLAASTSLRGTIDVAEELAKLGFDVTPGASTTVTEKIVVNKVENNSTSVVEESSSNIDKLKRFKKVRKDANGNVIEIEEKEETLSAEETKVKTSETLDALKSQEKLEKTQTGDLIMLPNGTFVEVVQVDEKKVLKVAAVQLAKANETNQTLVNLTQAALNQKNIKEYDPVTGELVEIEVVQAAAQSKTDEKVSNDEKNVKVETKGEVVSVSNLTTVDLVDPTSPTPIFTNIETEDIFETGTPSIFDKDPFFSSRV